MAELTEKKIGENAARMVSARMKTEINRSGLPFENNNNYDGQWKFPLSETKSVASFRKEELTSISLLGSRHLFIHHYGVKKERKSHLVRTKGNSFTRRSHPFSLKSRNMIDRAVMGSGAVNYLAEVLPKVKSDIVLEVFKRGLPNGKKS